MPTPARALYEFIVNVNRIKDCQTSSNFKNCFHNEKKVDRKKSRQKEEEEEEKKTY